MSASREKKKRQELLAGGAVDPKAAREAKEKADARKTNILYGSLGILFVVVAAALFFLNSSFYTRGRTAVTIDDQKYTVAEVSYYYGRAYQNFLNSSNGYYMMILGYLDYTKPLSTQVYPYDTTMTWADYFKDQAVSTMCFVHAATKAAAAEGITLGSEELENFDSVIAGMKEAAAEANTSYSQYISNIYGSNVTTSVYENCLKAQLLASKYADLQEHKLTPSESEIQEYYEENKDRYDFVDGAYVAILATPEEKKDEDGKAIEATEEDTAAALQAAQEKAQEILDAYANGGGSLEKIAELYDVDYDGGTQLRYTSSDPYKWLFDAERKSGDTEVLTNEAGTYVYVLVFNSRSRIEMPNYDIRHILITEDNLELGEGEEATDEQIEAKAQEILDQWKQNATEDNFAELAKEYSQDGNAADGGIYESVYWNQMVPTFNDWCYADGRKAGDTGIVESDYGYHIMYFVGYSDETYWHFACENTLLNQAYAEWEDSMIASVTAVPTSAMNSI